MSQPPDTFLAKAILIPVDEVATGFLKIDIKHMKELIKKGEISFIILQGTEMMRMWDIIEFIERHMQRYDPGGEMVKCIKEAMRGGGDDDNG